MSRIARFSNQGRKADGSFVLGAFIILSDKDA